MESFIEQHFVDFISFNWDLSVILTLTKYGVDSVAMILEIAVGNTEIAKD